MKAVLNKGEPVPANTSSVTETRAASAKVVGIGIAAIVVILAGAALFLFATLPDANAFNARVEQIFAAVSAHHDVEN